jgi:putative oxidoreductase
MSVLHPYPCPARISSSLGLLVVRLVAGAALMFHGWPKIQDPLGWMGSERYPGWLQAASAIAEFGGGIAFILGLLTPLFSLVLLGNMATAMYEVHYLSGDYFVYVNEPGKLYVASWELAALYASISLLLLLAGPGRLSVDACLFGKRQPPEPAH